MDSFNNNDPFKQLVKSKLADYKHEAPPAGWEDLERSLIATQQTKVIHTKWIASSVAAVAATLIGVFFLFQNTSKELPIQTAKNDTEQQVKPTLKEKEVKPLITKQSAIEIDKSSSSLFTDNVSSLQEEASIISITKKQENSLNTVDNSAYYQEKEEVEPSNNESSKDKNKLPDIDEERKQQMIQEFINEGKRSFDITDDTKTTKNKSKYAISLTGQSGFTSSQHTNTLPTTLRSSLNDSYGNYTMSKMQAYTQEEEVNPESETNHKQPVSFGILTSFNLTRRMQIETGLIYTYLSSETKNMAEDFNNAEKAQFHYLGIPINLNYTLLYVNKLNVFVTTGAMIEKDIYGKIKYSDEKIIPSLINSGYANKTSSKINQKNPQLSVAGGVGINYPLYNKTSLFGKIGGRYYIKANNEYKTYYSDEKLSLDIQLGLKFNF